MTLEQLIIQWEQERWPGSLMRCEHNYNVLKMEIFDEFARTKRMTFDDVDNIVKRLGNAQTDPNGKLIWIPIGAGHVSNMPHQDLKELADIRTLEDVKRIKALPKEKLMGYQRLRPADAPFQSLNERMAWIIEHKIQGSASVASAPAVDLTPVQKANQQAYHDAQRLLDRLTFRDVGSVKSAGDGPFVRLSKFITQKTAYLNECKKRNVPGAMALTRIREEIANLCDSGIK